MKRRFHCLGRLPGVRWAGALVLGLILLAGQTHTPLNAAGSVSELDSVPVAELRDTPTLQSERKPSWIDRHALVTRHNLEWNDPHSQVPLGNGEFCFNADATGLQTFGGNTLSHWAWHSAPLPPGCSPADVPPTGTVETGRIQGPMKTAAARGELDGWMFRNPHPINLGRLRFVRADGTALSPDDLSKVSRRYDLWSGLHTSRSRSRSAVITSGSTKTVTSPCSTRSTITATAATDSNWSLPPPSPTTAPSPPSRSTAITRTIAWTPRCSIARPWNSMSAARTS